MSDELIRQLNTLHDRIHAELAVAVRDQAEMLSNAQREALRSLETEPSGKLESTCIVLPTNDPFTYVVQAGGEATTVEVREGSGQAYDYAEAFEFGTSRQPARAFFWPTYRAKKSEILQGIAAAVQKVLR